MITLSWFNYEDTSAESFRVYRALPGFKFLFSAVTSNPVVFSFAATSPDRQNLSLDGSSIDAFVAGINGSARGITAVKDAAGTSVIIRLTARNGARLKLFSCPLLTQIGMSPKIIVPASDFIHVGTVAAETGTDPYVFEDEDGSPLDLYYITSVEDGKESIPSVIQSPLPAGPAYCVVQGRFKNIIGQPAAGVEVTAEPAVLSESGLTSEKITVISDAYGRVALPLIQGQQYVLHAPAIGYNQFIDVPADTSFLDMNATPATTEPEFSPVGDVP